MLGTGGTKGTERAVTAALNWLARHQTPKGNWSLQHESMCKDGVCSGSGSVRADAAATALGLLPFLAAGQTHKSKGPYQGVISKAIGWLIKQQKPTGDLSGNADQPMYSHGLATIAMCEIYGMSKDEFVRGAAMKALRFIEQAQNQSSGGWRYFPGDTGDTSAVGWQVMALKSPDGPSAGEYDGTGERPPVPQDVAPRGSTTGCSPTSLTRIPPHRPPPLACCAISIWAWAATIRRWWKAGNTCWRTCPAAPPNGRNTYYFYYATLVMHNIMGPEWDTWNRNMRGLLIATQDQDGCATGSWDPEKPTVDTWVGMAAV